MATVLFNSFEDKSDTVVCESCGSMVHSDYQADHTDFHRKFDSLHVPMTKNTESSQQT